MLLTSRLCVSRTSSSNIKIMKKVKYLCVSWGASQNTSTQAPTWFWFAEQFTWNSTLIHVSGSFAWKNRNNFLWSSMLKFIENMGWVSSKSWRDSLILLAIFFLKCSSLSSCFIIPFNIAFFYRFGKLMIIKPNLFVVLTFHGVLLPKFY